MNDELTQKAVHIAIKAFISTAEKELRKQKKNLINIDASNLLNSLGLLSKSFIFEFTIIFLKILLTAKDSNTQIEKNLSKLIREPYLTAMEQFKIASELKYITSEEKKYREIRFRDSLVNFDRALSFAEENEKPFINFLKGLCALNITGGRDEAITHLSNFQQSCKQEIISINDEISVLEKIAEENEIDASKIKIDNKPIGLGGGSLISMGASQDTLEKAAILEEVKSIRKKIKDLKDLNGEFLNTINYIEALINIAVN